MKWRLSPVLYSGTTLAFCLEHSEVANIERPYDSFDDLLFFNSDRTSIPPSGYFSHLDSWSKGCDSLNSETKTFDYSFFFKVISVSAHLSVSHRCQVSLPLWTYRDCCCCLMEVCLVVLVWQSPLYPSDPVTPLYAQATCCLVGLWFSLSCLEFGLIDSDLKTNL